MPRDDLESLREYANAGLKCAVRRIEAARMPHRATLALQRRAPRPRTGAMLRQFIRVERARLT